MAHSIFRKTSLDRISDPEQLNDYIRVTNPSVWMILCAVILLLTGVCVWGVSGRLDTTVTVGAVTENDQTICYIRDGDLPSVETGMQVQIADATYHIRSISPQPVLVDDGFAQYLLHVGGLSQGEWVYLVELDGVHGENGMITEAKIVIESIEPVRFVLN